MSASSGGRGRGGLTTTGQAVIVGDDPFALNITKVKTFPSAPWPYQGRYPCGSLMYKGTWWCAARPCYPSSGIARCRMLRTHGGARSLSFRVRSEVPADACPAAEFAAAAGGDRSQLFMISHRRTRYRYQVPVPGTGTGTAHP
eukprot:SAG11_NODE_787_length_7169_cov_4.571146_10_plen_143_part_00